MAYTSVHQIFYDALTTAATLYDDAHSEFFVLATTGNGLNAVHFMVKDIGALLIGLKNAGLRKLPLAYAGSPPIYSYQAM